MSTQGEKLDPRVKRTRGLLQRALTDLLSEKRFHTITVQDITERADVNRTTFYAHFEDKYALLNYRVREEFRKRVDQAVPELPGFTQENLRRLTVITGHYLSEFLGRCRRSAQDGDQAVLVRQVQVQCYESILEWFTRSWGRAAPYGLTPEVVAMVTSWAIFGSALQWVDQGGELTPEQLADQVLSLLKSGLQLYLP